MRVIDLIHQLLPAGTDAAYLVDPPTTAVLKRPGGAQATFPNYSLCPVWPPDLFAVVGTIIDRTGCYTRASPDRIFLAHHDKYLSDVISIAASWDSMIRVPQAVQNLWHLLVSNHGKVPLEDVCTLDGVSDTLLMLFAIADEASAGMGWDFDPENPAATEFALNVVVNAVLDEDDIDEFRLPHWPSSLCGIVSPNHVIVLPKSITTTKGCTIRSLSHHLALLPCQTMLEPSWQLVSRFEETRTTEQMNLLLVPFPFELPAGSFKLTSPRQSLSNGTTLAAYFGLQQDWLKLSDGEMISGADLARQLVIPLINAATRKSGATPTGVVLPECALSQGVAEQLVTALAKTGIEFLITGVLEQDPASGRWLNSAKTYSFVGPNVVVSMRQSKHHRWRIDKAQATSYGLDFDPDKTNSQWWEDIDVSRRQLPFYAVRRDMSMVTLICEDLARMDPAMNAIRAVGPNLVIALLMDGPQLATRWPGRYASVLGDEPGCAVLTVTCAATVDLSNNNFKTGNPNAVLTRTVARWTQADGHSNSIDLADGDLGVLVTVQSKPKHQTTLDNRSDRSSSRELSFLSSSSLGLK
ncbi:hypothetical protein [Duganella vulcania]|uniref:Uncharacterized protein n=1 Tax=Duganella vulcania TaxID=2692166 RepID=A0A845GPD2_9BURK|nr:hypothetical protein [Duganella vulcania]MYM96403.1 hypothetical protein [Duganella vulcania]